MAWEAVSKIEVGKLSGTRVEDLRDLWYDAAVALIAQKASVHNTANLTAIVDVLDGNGLSRIPIRRPPISSITSVTVDDVVLDSAKYTSDGSYVVLVDGFYINPYLQGDTFPSGTKNVSISYTSGSASDYAVALAIAMIIKEMANITTSEGAESRLQFSGVDRTSAQAFRYGRSGPGMAQRINEIIENLLGYRMRAK